MKILYDGCDVVVAVKPAGVLSEESATEQNMISYLSEQLGCKVFPVHRLDRAVGGAMVFAKNPAAASRMSAPGAFEKEYIAVVHGITGESGEWRDLLFKDSRSNKSFVVKRMRRGIREAALSFVKAASDGDLSLVSVKLETGRSHQIRVQFSSRRHPIVGDGKYGASDGCPIALFLRKIVFKDESGAFVEVAATPDTQSYPWSVFADRINCMK